MLGAKKSIEELHRRITSLELTVEELQEGWTRDVDTLRRQLVAVMNDGKLDSHAILGGMPFEQIQAEDAHAFIESLPDITIVDVRTDMEWQGGHIPQALHIDVQTLKSRIDELPPDKNRPVICFCAMGGRSAAACEMLAAAGHTRLINVEGGMTGYTGPVARD